MNTYTDGGETKRRHVSERATFLVDSDAFIGLFIATDIHHARVKTALSVIDQKGEQLATTSFVVAETATLISRRYAHALACRFVTFLQDSEFQVIDIGDHLREQAQTLFIEQTLEKVSLIDCANVAVVRYFGLQGIVSFDKFYTRFGINLAG